MPPVGLYISRHMRPTATGVAAIGSIRMTLNMEAPVRMRLQGTGDQQAQQQLNAYCEQDIIARPQGSLEEFRISQEIDVVVESNKRP